MNINQKVLHVAEMTMGSALTAIGIYFFKIPNSFSTGGVSGISTIVGKLVKNPFITPATLIVCLNIFLVILGFILLDKKDMIGTVYGSVVFSGLTWLFERVLPMESPMTDQPFLELVIGILLEGFGSALLFQCRASSGGTDIVALILKKFTSLDVGKALLLTDFFITCGAFVFGVRTGLFSLLGLFAKAFLVDSVIENINVCKSFMIVTEKPEEILSYIMNDMHHSATVLDGEGAYTHAPRKVIYTLCRRYEGVRLKQRIHEIDPESFVIVVSTSEIIGRGFRSV